MAARPKKTKRRKPKRAYNRVGPPSKPIAFRLPEDIVKMVDRAARKKHLSRNKTVELVLRNSLTADYSEPEMADVRQIDLFA